METKIKKAEKFSASVTWKGIVIVFISFILLIPGAMIQSLITERKVRSEITIQNINELWSRDQTFTGPVLNIPYETVNTNSKNETKTQRHTLTLTPSELKITGKLSPEERHYGIYKAILYKSDLQITGTFRKPDFKEINHSKVLWDEATIKIGITDLRGVTVNPNIELEGKVINLDAGGSSTEETGTGLIGKVQNLSETDTLKEISFSGKLALKGSNSLNFIPMGKSTRVNLSGKWSDPGFTGSFSPEHKMTEKDFSAEWNVLHFNRNIPEFWIDGNVNDLTSASFGVNLVNMVDHYQQNERSAKYAIMFIALTFVVFFFVEIFTKKKVHPIQYALVGASLILFYTLLLSLSEQIGFGFAYLASAIAIICMITLYAKSIFKNMKHAGILSLLLAILYTFLYVIIQIEDIALLIGSIGLFIILGVIMFVSGKINWYKTEITDENPT